MNREKIERARFFGDSKATVRGRSSGPTKDRCRRAAKRHARNLTRKIEASS